jgi:hypothetical protein
MEWRGLIYIYDPKKVVNCLLNLCLRCYLLRIAKPVWLVATAVVISTGSLAAAVRARWSFDAVGAAMVN